MPTALLIPPPLLLLAPRKPALHHDAAGLLVLLARLRLLNPSPRCAAPHLSFPSAFHRSATM